MIFNKQFMKLWFLGLYSLSVQFQIEAMGISLGRSGGRRDSDTSDRSSVAYGREIGGTGVISDPVCYPRAVRYESSSSSDSGSVYYFDGEDLEAKKAKEKEVQEKLAKIRNSFQVNSSSREHLLYKKRNEYNVQRLEYFQYFIEDYEKNRTKKALTYTGIGFALAPLCPVTAPLSVIITIARHLDNELHKYWRDDLLDTIYKDQCALDDLNNKKLEELKKQEEEEKSDGRTIALNPFIDDTSTTEDATPIPVPMPYDGAGFSTNTENATQGFKKKSDCQNFKEGLLALAAGHNLSKESIAVVDSIDCESSDDRSLVDDKFDWQNLAFSSSLIQSSQLLTQLGWNAVANFTMTLSTLQNQDREKITLGLNNVIQHLQSQRQLHQQIQRRVIENQFKAVRDFPETFLKLSKYPSLQNILNNPKVTIESCSYGYRGDDDAQILNFKDEKGKLVSMVMPASPNIEPYILPEDKKAQKDLFNRDLEQKKVDEAHEKHQKQVAATKQAADEKYKKLQDNFKKDCQNLEQNQDKILDKLKKQGVGSHEDKLPLNTDLVCDKNGKPLRDELGRYFAKNGEKLQWNPQEQKWHAYDLRGNHIIRRPAEKAEQPVSAPVPSQQPLDTQTKKADQQQATGDTKQENNPVQNGSLPAEQSQENNDHEEVEDSDESIAYARDPKDKEKKRKQKEAREKQEAEKKAGGPQGPESKNVDSQAKLKDKKNYLNGEYRESDKHNPNAPDYIGKPPKDGQKCLNNSFPVEKSKERVSTEDGKIIILKYTKEGEYHGYIVEDFHSIKNPNAQHALFKNGLVNNMKSGKVIK